jgi:hypothetical protein
MSKVQGSTHCPFEANVLESIDHLLGRFYTFGERDPEPLKTILKPFKMIVEELPPKSCKQKVKKYTVILDFESGTQTTFHFEYKKPRLSLLW